jgi:hypothetical protein
VNFFEPLYVIYSEKPARERVSPNRLLNARSDEPNEALNGQFSFRQIPRVPAAHLWHGL